VTSAWDVCCCLRRVDGLRKVSCRRVHVHFVGDGGAVALVRVIFRALGDLDWEVFLTAAVGRGRTYMGLVCSSVFSNCREFAPSVEAILPGFFHDVRGPNSRWYLRFVLSRVHVGDVAVGDGGEGRLWRFFRKLTFDSTSRPSLGGAVAARAIGQG